MGPNQDLHEFFPVVSLACEYPWESSRVLRSKATSRDEGFCFMLLHHRVATLEKSGDGRWHGS